jgi:hypothetical protein
VSRLAQAEAADADVTDLGRSAALIVAQAFRARIAPEATQGIISAALTLGADQSRLLASAPPIASDYDMLTAAEALAASAWTMGWALWQLRAQAEADIAAAARIERQARAEESKSGSTPGTAAAISCARQATADCEAAIELADVILGRLAYAHMRLGQVPDDLATYFDTPYDHLRRGRSLPNSGDFLAPEPTEGAA